MNFDNLRRLFTNLPFRMTIGKFGIWLVKVGRILQIRYANWNSEFRLKCHADENYAAQVTIEVSEPLTEETVLSFGGPSEQSGKQTPLVRDLFKIKGVSTIHLRRYRIDLYKGGVFSWDEILPSVEKTILAHLTAK